MIFLQASGRRWRISTRIFATIVFFALFSPPVASAHRLDEYLQAAILSIEPSGITLTLRLVPGVAVAPGIIAAIDTHHNGILSPAEQQQYAATVAAALSLTEDGRQLPLLLKTLHFPSLDAMRQGTGEIELTFNAPYADGLANHHIGFRNRFQPRISVYLVNSLVPADTRLAFGAQTRNVNQSDYTVEVLPSNAAHIPRLSWSGFRGAFHLGTRHIAEGTDHLLFLLTLLLPAPLLAVAGRWTARAGSRRTLLEMLRIVTAFTLGHSITLALAIFGVVHVPSQPIEVLIAVSILVSAIHALRPLFPGRGPFVAAFFGLIHGMAFASALTDLGINAGYRLVSLLGFNLGIECMQLAVVCLTLPPLLVLSRTRFYSWLRVPGALIAGTAACAWIVARMTQRENVVAAFVERYAQHGWKLCIALYLLCGIAWLSSRRCFKHPQSP